MHEWPKNGRKQIKASSEWKNEFNKACNYIAKGSVKTKVDYTNYLSTKKLKGNYNLCICKTNKMHSIME